MGDELDKANVWCGRYDQCLDEAVKTGKRFGCSGCKFELDQTGKASVDGFPYYLLLAAIFFPEAYRQYRRDKVEEAFGLIAGLESLKEKISRPEYEKGHRDVLGGIE